MTLSRRVILANQQGIFFLNGHIIKHIVMRTDLKRRDFVTRCFKAGVSGCALLYGTPVFAQDQVTHLQKSDLISLTYCGFKCTSKCTLYRATMENDNELRKKAFEEFKMKEKYNIDYNPENVFCYGCKTKDKPLSINVNACTTRKCAIEKGYDCCIECKGLTACDKELWKSFPQFKEKVIEMQKSYFGT
jgi:hypothetical protein